MSVFKQVPKGVYWSLAVILAAGGFLFFVPNVLGFFSNDFPRWIASVGALAWYWRLLIFLAGIGLIALFGFLAWREKEDGRTLMFAGAGLATLVVLAAFFAQNPGSAEVTTRHIGLVYNSSGFSDGRTDLSDLMTDAVDDLQDGVGITAEVKVMEYDLAEREFEPGEFRTFIRENNLRYIIVSERLTDNQIDTLFALADGLALPMIVVPQADGSSELLASEALGVFLSPEAEGTVIAQEIAEASHSDVVIVWDEAPGEEGFHSRFADELWRSLPVDASGQRIRLSDFLRANLQGRRDIQNADAIVISGRENRVRSALTMLDQAELNVPVYVTSKMYGRLRDLGLPLSNVRISLPWRLSGTLQGDEPRDSLGVSLAGRRMRMSDVDALAASAIVIAFHSSYGRIDESKMRETFLANQDEFSDSAWDIYGQVSFVDDSIPHLRVNQLVVSEAESVE